MCVKDDDVCKSIAYFTADVELFERDGTGAVDCDEEYIGKYEWLEWAGVGVGEKKRSI